ncbi:MAG: glycosyltransferase family 39 protein [Ktedonobacterales bacterium]
MFQTIAAPARRRLTLPALRVLLLPHRLGMLGVTIVSLFCNFWMLGQNGYGNLFYAATVKSMGSNWHAFFFASFDPAGFVTVDKPPLGFWLQVVSTKVFGFTPFAVFLPQALAGVLSVVLLYWLVRRHFGRVAGIIAAAALALSPISVVTNRNNTIDSTLTLVLLLAAWATFRAIETDKLRWLMLSGALVAVGFNIKMLEAYLVVPAFALAYLLSSNKPWVRRLANLTLSGVVMAGISLVWVVVVDLVPAGLRPWVGSTQDNSELSLALGYNGVQRLLGMGGGLFGGRGGTRGAGGFQGGPRGISEFGGFPGANGQGSGLPPGAPSGSGFGTGGPRQGGGFGNGGPGGGTGMFNTGNPGLFRLFMQPLGGQIVWLLPLALIGIVALALARRFRPREDRQQQSLILWGTWLLTMAVFFSVAGFFHQYYLSQMAPAIAAMSGIGIVTMWDQYRGPGWRGWLLPLSLAVTAAEQISIIVTDPSWGAWLIPVIAIPAALATLALIVMRVLRMRPGTLDSLREFMPQLAHDLSRTVSRGAVTVGLVALLAVPAVWSFYPALTNIASDLPVAGATTMVGNANPGNSVDSKLIAYLEAHQGSATYLVATPSSNAADTLILATGKAVMALGGFTGSDPILTGAQLQALVRNGTVRYFLLNGGNTRASIDANGGSTSSSGSVINVGGPNGNQNAAVQWVQQNCTTVPTSEWQLSQASGNTTPAGGTGGGGSQQLYECSGN